MEKTKIVWPHPTRDILDYEDFAKSHPSIFIFKTNVREYVDAQIISKKLLSHFPGSEISFDLGDCDKVLRIKHFGRFAARAIELLNLYGFDCEELMD